MDTPPEGVIIPPQAICPFIEKTAGYVNRNGNNFEAQLRERKGNEPKFSFLNPDDPYHSYYLWRLNEYKEGKVQSSTNDDLDSNGNNNSEATSNVNSKFKEPTKFDFIINHPNISSLDLDIIKMTSLFIAKNGKDYLINLQQKEKNNFQYDFLKPAHSFNFIFQEYIKQYKIILNNNNHNLLKDKINNGLKNHVPLLESAYKRAEFQQFQFDEENKKQKEEEDERIEFAKIDWDDFVIVETIDITEADKEAELNSPLILSQLQFASLEQKQYNSLKIEEAPPDYEPEEPKARSDIPKQVNSEEEKTEPQAPPIHSSRRNVKIREAGYVRNKNRNKPSEATFVSPLTGERISKSQNDIDEHMRIVLLNSKYKEEKARADAKTASTNLAYGEVYENVKRLASARQDVYDVNEEDENRHKIRRTEVGNPVQWDGYKNSIKRVGRMAKSSVTEEAKQRQEEELRKQREAIGPSLP